MQIKTALALSSLGTTAAADHTMNFIGCPMAENVAQGYVAVVGKRMWPNYGASGSPSAASRKPSRSRYASSRSRAPRPTRSRRCANARARSSPEAAVYLTGQPLYDAGYDCFPAGTGSAQTTDAPAETVASAASLLNATYPASFILHPSEV